jgi:AraC-like DNA-binding protein
MQAFESSHYLATSQCDHAIGCGILFFDHSRMAGCPFLAARMSGGKFLSSLRFRAPPQFYQPVQSPLESQRLKRPSFRPISSPVREFPSYALGPQNALPPLQSRTHAQEGPMNSKLHHIQNWEELAQQAKWSVSNLAKLCAVSTRTLGRHFRCCFAKTPKTWLSQKRQKSAITLLQEGKTVKEIAYVRFLDISCG